MHIDTVRTGRYAEDGPNSGVPRAPGSFFPNAVWGKSLFRAGIATSWKVMAMPTSSFEKPLALKDKRALDIMAKGFERTGRAAQAPFDIDADLHIVIIRLQ